jgi:outer membrane protein assembly factor BamA
VLGMDSRDSKRDPRRGWENEIQVWKTGGWLGGDGDFTTADLDVRRYQPLGRRSTLLLSNLTSLQSGVLGADSPVYLDYLMGGSNSIRGHSVDELGKELYGKNQWLVTLEMQQNLLPVREIVVIKWPVTLGLQVALFADGGIAWSESEDLAMDRVKTGFGIGVRPLLPGVGMLRLDLAVSADGVRFNLATMTKPEAQRQRIR